jgi:hypothetical protein
MLKLNIKSIHHIKGFLFKKKSTHLYKKKLLLQIRVYATHLKSFDEKETNCHVFRKGAFQVRYT